MKKSQDNKIDLYVECWSKFFDVDGNSVTLTTSTAGPITSPPSPNGSLSTKKPSSEVPSVMVYTIGGSAVFLLLTCMLFIVCMVMSRKTRSERRRRKAAEAESNVMKTTMTSITDTEDNTTYAEVSMGDPTYRDGHIELPSRKRTRIGGVSNGLQTVKRFFSVEGNQPTSAQPYAATREPTRREPLPAIPEASQKSNSFPRSREQSEKRLSYRNPEYEEIGPEFLRRSHIYNPLVSSTLKVTDTGSSPYEALRKSTLSPIPGSTRSLPKETNMEDNYFIVEKEGDGYSKVVKDKAPADGAYFIVEKETELPSRHEPPSPDGDIDINVIPSSPPCEEDAERQPMLGTTSSGCWEASSAGESDNNYFLLEKSNGSAPSETDYRDYVQPMDKQRNSYIDILPDHVKFVDIKNQSDERRRQLTNT
ncbi:hypothetical protein KP79_PYT11813 [Mizuhopecten yessoensis]|uniref:Uncharacterized protein n=2 Tax=Mizuhopecten yessoensis TaxID=6573 RepID=A0A210QKW7_MIZYE|nr:hypothetical protein KP79_PYT11813 [Mizuhopecten yessoensis]